MLYGLGGYAQYPLASLVPAISNSFTIVALPGSLAATGKVVSLRIAEGTTFCSYSMIGVAATAAVSFPVTFAGAVLAGLSAPFGISERANSGSDLLSGTAVSFTTGFRAIGVGAYNLDGPLAPLVVSLQGLSNSYGVAGYPSVYSRGFEDWVPRPFDEDNWADRITPQGSWTANLAQLESWVATAASTTAWTPATDQPEPWSRE